MLEVLFLTFSPTIGDMIKSDIFSSTWVKLVEIYLKTLLSMANINTLNIMILFHIVRHIQVKFSCCIYNTLYNKICYYFRCLFYFCYTYNATLAAAL